MLVKDLFRPNNTKMISYFWTFPFPIKSFQDGNITTQQYTVIFLTTIYISFFSTTHYSKAVFFGFWSGPKYNLYKCNIYSKFYDCIYLIFISDFLCQTASLVSNLYRYNAQTLTSAN